MKKTHIALLYITLAVSTVLTAGCKKAPIDRNVEGLWKLEQFVTLSDGQTHPCERIYFSMQMHVVKLEEKQGPLGLTAFVGELQYGDDHSTLTMSGFRGTYSTGDNGTMVGIDKDTEGNIIYPVEMLNPYGINSTETQFDVVKADGKNLILRSNYATLTFTSF